ncbi:outer membrane protein assembly factor BamE [Candidatus Pantoea edessiphila]|uniref:Outer membrane protein assembly factor BamE n=1 Tax=Candidatus Pantoea edessiphila TaxID=2044610 RepID=A0A2P5T2X4_9GAMM|nr:outer membrane protein assembly factor BamE [Candidatus Pantoea edessiphila]PPI88945.1 outer membrane protein assembly factor BamE [Candidatus Pantoea edessiphila]
MISKKLFITLLSTLVLILTGCSDSMAEIIRHPDVNQGNYLATSDINKIHLGMTKKQVIKTIGTPLIEYSFSDKEWYYVFSKEIKGNKLQQQTLTLSFNNKGILIYILNLYKDKKLHVLFRDSFLLFN